MEQSRDIENLLKEVFKTIKSECKEQTPFNAFDVARIYSEETRHSAIVASLLDPKGPLEKGEEPLKAFFRQVGLYNIAKLCNEKTKVETEYSIPGRRMDIVITSDPDKPEKKFCVVIENKTATTDHELQLEDYRKWLDDDQKAYQYRALLYLTYKGDDAKNFQGEYGRISYRTHICNWLRECALMLRNDMEKAVFCSQYCDFITNTLLGKEMEMSEELWKAIAGNFNAAIQVCENIDQTKAYLLNKYLTPAFEKKDFSVTEKQINDIIKGRGLDYNVSFKGPSYEIELGFDHYYFWGTKTLIKFCNLEGNEDNIKRIREFLLNRNDSDTGSNWEIEKNLDTLVLGKHDDEFRLNNVFFDRLTADETKRSEVIEEILGHYDGRRKEAVEVANAVLDYIRQSTTG
ncbi:MAG: PD-(D/E)XK nuclease family protein [Lentisphaeria bacterium]|nr:PD-(D/E)XK nuclease family protein [Lentisphaeria bacterium]